MVNSNNKNTKRAALIGLGKIFLEYKKGLETTDKFNLVALMDINPQAQGRDLFPDLPFYQSFEELIENEKLDLVIISTPPRSHYELIKKSLNAGLNVIVEKPMLLDFSQFEDLYSLAESKHLCLATSYHWQSGEEVKEFNKLYDPKLISEIVINVDDPYSDDGININDNRKHLEGSWIDSGVNALSLVKLWLPFEYFTIEDIDVVFAHNVTQPIYSKVQLKIDGVKTTITVDWRNQKNNKRSYVIYDGRRIDIKHSEQKIYDGDKVIACDSMDRLSRHYYNYFNNFNFITNEDETVSIHKILLTVRDEYEKTDY